MTATLETNKSPLKLGSQGDDVRELQNQLNAQFYPAQLTVDGVFGAQTDAAVRRFQKRMFLQEDGIVGEKTWQTLAKKAPVDMPILQVGSTGSYVFLLEERLANNGYDGIAIDGNYTEATAEIVRKFQANGLTVNGIVGEETWFALSRVPNI